MTAGKEWNGYEAATGGYIIIKKDGDVLCYHLHQDMITAMFIKSAKSITSTLIYR